MAMWVILVDTTKTSGIAKYVAEYGAKGVYTEDIDATRKYCSRGEAFADVKMPDIEIPVML